MLVALCILGLVGDVVALKTADAQLGLLSSTTTLLLLLLVGLWGVFAQRLGPEGEQAAAATMDGAGGDQLFAKAFLASGLGMAEASPRGRWLKANPAMSRILGYTEDAFLATPLLSLTHPEDASLDVDLLGKLDAGEIQTYQVEKRFIHRDGHAIWGLMTVSAIPGKRTPAQSLFIQLQDITDRKRSEIALLESENRYRLMAENSGDMISRHEPDGTYLYASHACRALLGYEPEELVGRTPYEFIHPEDLDEVVKYHPTLLDLPPGHPLYYRSRRRDGEYVWVETTCQMVAEVAGSESQEVIAITRDISERRKMQDNLLRVTKAVESSSDGIGIVDTEGEFVYLNGAFLELFGYSAEELNAAGGSVILYSNPAKGRGIAELVGRGESWSGEMTMVNRQGRPFPVSLRANPIRDRSGKIIGQIGIYTDITERRLAEEQVKKLSEAVEHSSAMVMITDSSGQIEYVNPRFTQTTGYSAEEAVGRTPRILKSGQTPSDVYADLWSTITAGDDWRGFMLNHRKDGNPFWCSSSISPLRNGEGTITHFVAVLEDVTAIKEAEAALREAKESAEVANRAKSEFLASMSHEIRTPMNAIIGMADLLWETTLTQEQRRYVQVFRSAGANLLSLINDVLDLSKVEAGQLHLESIEFDSQELIEKTCEVMAVRAHKKGLELTCRVGPEVPGRLIGDPVRLRQIVTNLVGNAIKFTEVGEVALDVRTIEVEPVDPGRSTGRCRLLFSVRDSGIGIPQDKIDAVFERFTQADSSVTRKYGGTGLGLAISRQLVELMGGRIWVESDHGAGSTFFFTAEFSYHYQAERIRQELDLRGIRVLVADDNGTTRDLLGEALSSWGAAVALVGSGEGALREARKGTLDGKEFDLLFLDWHISDLGGWEVVDRFRREALPVGKTIAMLTTADINGSRVRPEEMGVAGCLAKPLKQAELLETVRAAMGGGTSVHPEPTGGDHTAVAVEPDALRILLVEDSEDNRLLIQAFLKKTPHEVSIAENGEIAVEKFKTGQYDLVLMDMQMPIMDGYTATRRIRQWETQSGVPATPIVALTAHALTGDAEKSLEAGCDAHLTKPIKKATLLEQVDHFSKRARK